ncbi:pyruvate phosphate dikinase, partial [Acetobacter tropicalis]
HHPSA